MRKPKGVSGNGLKQVRVATRAWSRVGAIDLATVGRRRSSAAFSEADGKNVVVFEDPNGSIPGRFSCATGGILAMGGWWSDGRTHRIGRRWFLTITEGDIVFQNGLECFFRASPNGRKALEEITAHELGHTIGLHHSCGDAFSGPCNTKHKNDALMRAFAHNDGRGAAIKTDDRRGALKGLKYR
jgi:hypothetical protein